MKATWLIRSLFSTPHIWPFLAASAPRVALPAIWNTPYPRNPFFVGRDTELALVRHHLLGYPTQKPEALLERIIAASSNEGDWILDPFCGWDSSSGCAEVEQCNRT